MPRLAAAGCAAVLLLAACGDGDSGGSTSSGASGDGKVSIGLILKTETNPFFVKVKTATEAAAKEKGAELQTFAGKTDGDNQSQVDAIENLITAGADGIILSAADSKAIVPSVEKARKAGILVVAVGDTLEPTGAADATFATDNFQAGELIGKWAKATLETQGKEARIALLDYTPAQVSVDVQRDQGFLQGFGIDLADKNKIGDEKDKRIVGNAVGEGTPEGGRSAMENLLQKDPGINLVYTINEPTAAGAYEAIKAAGKEKDIIIVSVDGGCEGVANVKSGVIGATAMQFPTRMASEAVKAVVDFEANGTKPSPSDGLDISNTGVELITDKPAAGVESKDPAFGASNCWG